MDIVEDAEVIESRCGACGAVMTIGATQRTERCPFCDAPSVVTRPAAPGRPQPTFALGFVIDRDTATRAVAHWIGRQKMAPAALKAGVAERVTGIYLPAYLYSATAESHYQASIGETYRALALERDDDDGGVKLGRKEKTEYRDLTGRHLTYVADVLVSASRSLANDEVKAIESFDFSQLRRYSPALIAGWTSEEPTLTPDECFQLARTDAQERIDYALRRFMPGDDVRSLQRQTQFVNESIELALVPVWVYAIRYDPRKPSVRILVNGQTGKVSGTIPFSWAKLGLIAAIVALAIAFLIVFGLLASGLR
jgi:hypothetical protein